MTAGCPDVLHKHCNALSGMLPEQVLWRSWVAQQSPGFPPGLESGVHARVCLAAHEPVQKAESMQWHAQHSVHSVHFTP